MAAVMDNGDSIAMGVGLLLLGVLYVVKPNLFQRWIWTRTSIMQRLLGPEGYRRYMKGLGVVFALVGVGLIAFGCLHHG